MSLFLLNLLLALVWSAVTGNFSLPNIILGFVLGFGALWVPRPLWGESAYFSRVTRVLRLALLFLYELVLSSLRVTADVLRPGYNFRPGVIALPLDCQSDIEIATLANLITLTPGTLSLEVTDDNRVLYVHAMDVENDPAGLKADIKDGFERRVIEAFE